MAKVVFLSLVFPPDGVSTAQIMGDLATQLRMRGHDVLAITTTPHYNRDAEAEQKQPLRPVLGPALFASEHAGTPVLHIPMPRKGRSYLVRMLAWAYFHLYSFAIGIRHVLPGDVLIVPSPPLTIGVVAWAICLLKGARYIYNVQELYPDCAISMGAIKNKRLQEWLFSLERFVYSKAAAVTTITSGMALKITEKGTPAAKVRIVPNFADPDALPPGDKINPFSIRHGLAYKFVVSYAGNIGPAQDLGLLLNAAKCLADRSDIQFLIMGDGTDRRYIRSRIEQEGLSNVTMLDYQPFAVIPDVYATTDLGLVPQAGSISESAIPSKVYRIMAAGRPILTYTTPGSDLDRLITGHGCGLSVEAGNVEKLVEAILDAASAPRKLKRMGTRGRELMMSSYTLEAIAHRYDDLVKEVRAGVA